MGKRYARKKLLFISVSVLMIAIASCKKDNNTNVQQQQKQVTPVATPTQIGLYEADSSIYKELDVAISQIGTQTANDYGLVFDTGSGGMVIDADGILPASMITSTGFNFTGDSTVVDGITITNQKSTVEYGDDAATTDKVYGNLAYANITIGDQPGATIVVKRLPFFLYYKAIDSKGHKFDPHEFDVFGVNSEYDITFANNAYITSPFSYFDPGYGLTKGFKMAALGTDNFTFDFNYVPGVITLGLTADDLSSSSGFTVTALTSYPGDGYPPIFKATVTYGDTLAGTYVIFDTGTDPYSYIEVTKGDNPAALLPVHTAVSFALDDGYGYNYTVTAADNLTFVESSTTSGSDVSVVSLEFFLNHEYMVDFTDHTIGLKSD